MAGVALIRFTNGSRVTFHNADQIVHGGSFLYVNVRCRGQEREVSFRIAEVKSTEFVEKMSEIGFRAKAGST
jgi:hypothetical protein